MSYSKTLKPEEKVLWEANLAAFKRLAGELKGELADPVKRLPHQRLLAETMAGIPKASAEIEDETLTRFSELNQLLVILECRERDISLDERVHTAPDWRKLGMRIKAGETGIGICAPRTKKNDEGLTEMTGIIRKIVYMESQMVPFSGTVEAEEE
jgi:hypothetical protein